MGVVVHAPQIMRSKSRASAAFLAVSEWTVGAAGAMFLAMVAPEIMSRFVPDYVFTSPAAELGLYGFLGGSFGRGMFRALVSVSYRLFYRAVGVDGRGWDGKTDRRKGA